jgi:hypothetical protein
LHDRSFDRLKKFSTQRLGDAEQHRLVHQKAFAAVGKMIAPSINAETPSTQRRRRESRWRFWEMNAFELDCIGNQADFLKETISEPNE